MAKHSKEELERASANLKLWSERPVGKANARVFGVAAIVIVMMLIGARQSPDPVGFVRSIAVAFLICQGTLHFVSRAVLQTMVGLGVPAAATALAACRDPRRLTNLDMAMMWGLVALAAPYFE